MQTASDTLVASNNDATRDFFRFKHLPDYCRFLLDHHLNDFCAQQLRLARELNIPLMKLLDGMPEEQLIALSLKGIVELFESIINGHAKEYLDKSNEDWKNNRVPVLSIAPEDVVSEDITLVSYTRKQGFMSFLPRYTDDLETYAAVLTEVDRFQLYYETSSFRTYADILTQQLRRNEALYKQAQAISRLGNWTWDLTTNAITWTDELYRIFGLDPRGDKITYERYTALIHPDDRDMAKAAVEQAVQTKKPFEFYHRALLDDGSVRYIHSKGEVVVNTTGDAVRLTGTGQDITENTERKRNEARLRESEERFRAVADSAPVLIWMAHPNGERYYFNKAWTVFTGIAAEDAIGFKWLAALHPDDRERFRVAYMAALEARQPFTMEYRLRRHDGVYRWIVSNGVPRYGNDGEFLGSAGSIVDMDDRKRLREVLEQQVKERTAELQKANQELERSNKELSSFSYVASHDLQEPLRKIQTFSSRILERDFANLSPSGKDSLVRMNDAASRMKQLIEDLLTYSRISAKTKEPVPVDLDAVLNEIRTTHRESFQEKSVSLTADRLPTVLGIPYQLTQLFDNLIGNSVKYRKPDVPPAIEIRCETVSGKDTHDANANPAKTYYRISVHDNGIGFDPKHAARIFEVFQRLHNRDEYAGTGIGLSICKKILENHHGFITANGEPGSGATFAVYLPAQ